MSHLRRREFIGLLGGAAAWPLAARAQQPGGMRRVGVFVTGNVVMGPPYRAFLEELRRMGFHAGQNLLVDHKPSDQSLPALTEAAREMARANPDVIVALGSEPALQASMQASQTIPIVFMANNYDPIARGYVQSLAKPGGNVTGVSLRQTELAEKQVELLTEAFPDRSRLAVLWDRISADQFEAAERRAKLLSLQVQSRKMETAPYDIATALRDFERAGTNMLLALTSPFFASQRDQLVELAFRHRLPTMFVFKVYVEAGGLMSYGTDPLAMARQSATLAGKILHGTKPAELPVELPTKYEMAVNLKTAKAMGIELPTSILLRADEVIE